MVRIRIGDSLWKSPVLISTDNGDAKRDANRGYDAQASARIHLE